MKLTIELVPSTAWYSNVRSNVTRGVWDEIRQKAYSKANHQCEICGEVGLNQGVKHRVECHEIWDYNDVTHEQKLLGFIALCPYCHKTKHAGLARINQEEELVLNQLMKVNQMTRIAAEDYLTKSFNIWSKRSQYQWVLDIEMITNYLLFN